VNPIESPGYCSLACAGRALDQRLLRAYRRALAELEAS
jgi:hypothetical protein